eukprot:CAMPEP_0177769950 /NCGR_PEP_ID=MMETSP0491_2-20121128/10634_1 /TAXON_ID=63592 /ORGANISM="Tetraselmis chuii, Strain PLY429" /LENGTH=217 /DNA_ID=CAMNT_0019287071 /DNA_START=301 /DNA_END=954 /DNA_ORIENTATION=+
MRVMSGMAQLRVSSAGQQRLRLSRSVAPRQMVAQRVRAMASQQPLLPWQAVRLHEEFAKGRRQVKVREVAGELQMEREDVIHWLKEFGSLSDSARASLHDAAIAAHNAGKERKEVLRAEREAAVKEKKQSFKERQAEGGDFAKKQMSKAARDTLETVWQKTRWPNDEVIQGIYKLHRIPRRKTLDWFAERRAEETGGERARRKDREEKRFMNEKYGR